MRFPGHRPTRREHLRHAYHSHFADHRRERLFLSTTGFFMAFGLTRAITHSIKAGIGPFHDIGGGGRHIHHMTFGILGNLAVGYLWLMQVGTQRHPSPVVSRATAVLYGVGTALTLDEFALWLDLEDDYWSAEGRKSIDAVVAFGSALALGALGGGGIRDFVRRVRDPRHSRESGRAADKLRGLRRRLLENW